MPNEDIHIKTYFMHLFNYNSNLFQTTASTVFLDLDYADDVALLAEMLEVLILSLHVMQEEARPFGLEINWSKTKIQTTVDPCPTQGVQVDGNVVDIVDSFTYLGSLVDRNGR